MTRIFYDKLAAEYAQHRHVHLGVLCALCETLTPHSRVLEVGCGTGNYIGAIHSLVECDCWGVDPSAKMLDQTRIRYPQVHTIQSSVETLPLMEPFDLIFSVDVIHHLEGIAAHYQAAYCAVKPAGQVCTVTDSEWIIRHRQPLSIYFPESIQIELARYPRIAELVATMEKTEFVEITDRTVEHHALLTDIGAYRDKAFSILHLLPDQAYQRGLRHMERDLQRGPIPTVSRYTMLWGRRPL